MPNEDRAWDLDRLPTKAERIVGSFVATSFFLLTFAFFSFATYRLYLTGKLGSDTDWLFAISALLFLVAAVFLWRTVFTKPSKPTGGAISVTGYAILVSGVALLVLCAIYGTRNLSAAWVGIAAVVGGAVLVKNGRRAREP